MKVTLAGLFLLFPLSFSAYSASCDFKYTMGWESWEPYQYHDGTALGGLDIDLVRAIVGNTGCEIDFKEAGWKRHLTELEKGSIHLAAGASKTPEREEYAHFSLPYRTESMVLYVRKGEAAKFKFKNLIELSRADFKLGVTRGYYYGEEFEQLSQKEFFSDRIEVARSDEINFRKLVRGRIDGFLVEPFVGAEMRNNHVCEGAVEVHPVHIYANDIFVMLSKKTVNESFVTAFNKSLNELKSNGKYKAIIDQYLE